MRPTRLKTVPPAVPLPVGTRLDRYEVRGVLGHGPLHVTYRAIDAEADLDVVVREYLPPALARREGATQVVPLDDAAREVFQEGLRFFVNEGQLMPRFEHPSIVRVLGSWEANGTAYLAMPLLVGRDMHQTFAARPKPPREQTLRAMLASLLDALEVLHHAKVEHRDLSPRSIMILAESSVPVLMDMSSPRRVMAARGDTGPMGPREGYAGIELYGKAEGLERGPWTDLYALGAVMYWLIAGKPPPPAPQRTPDDRIAQAQLRSDGRYAIDFLAIVDWMLAPQPKDRPRSVADLRAVLAGRPLPEAFAPRKLAKAGAVLKKRRRWLIGLVALGAAGGAAAGGWWLMRSGKLPWRWPSR